MTLTAQQREYIERRIAEIRDGGTSKHSVWVQDRIAGHGAYNLAQVEPKAVGLANDDDGYYVQYFNNRAEVEAFITELRAAADEAWGAA